MPGLLCANMGKYMQNDKKKLASTDRIGIINRGEAAFRFIRAVKEFNSAYRTQLTTVAFFMEVEREALFMKEADVACPISGLPGFSPHKGNPYLDKELMLEALIATNCQAVWVGWGFLAENASFVSMLENRQLVFLGPSARAMTLLGDKIDAKRLAESAQVPILPWSKKPVRDLAQAREVAADLGYPVIIKAARAGGGRGIRAVKNPDELGRQYQSARDETLRITGGDILYIEHLVERARHLEVQIVADRYGHVATFGVRDCSIQRRNQKVIEETPPHGLDQKTLREIEATAARLVLAADYEGAGTVEFLYDLGTDQLYFMEVNTRLQVEHPITEALYNVDLVKKQIEVAMGKELTEKNVDAAGCAMEVRLNAEDPEKDFIPAPGKVSLFKIPSGPGIRVDSGIEEGSTIPTEFDSMVAKIIAFAPGRAETISRLERALQELRIKIEGGTTNRAFLLELLNCEAVRHGAVHIHFVEELLQQKRTIIRRQDWDIALLASAIEQYARQYLKELLHFGKQAGNLGHPREIPARFGYEIELSLAGQSYGFLVKAQGNNMFHVDIRGGETMAVQYLWHGQERVMLHEDKRYAVLMVPRGNMLQCEINGVPYPLELDSCGVVRAPSPAIVIAIAVTPGQTVQKGELLVTLEAMKMEIAVAAPQTGVIKAICVKKGEQIGQGQPLLQLDSLERKATQEEKRDLVSFARMRVVDVSQKWYILAREFLSVFLGYDHTESTMALLPQMLNLAKDLPDLQAELIQTILKALEIYVSVETLFSHEQIQGDDFPLGLSCQEFLMLLLRRKVDKDKAVPKKFLANLDRAIDLYKFEGQGKDEIYNRTLFRIYKSHADLKIKQELLRAVLQTLEAHCLPTSVPSKLADILDEITQLTQTTTPALADAAIHTRYVFFDRIFIEQLKANRRDKVAKLLELIKENNGGKNREELVQDVIDAGNHIVLDLMQMTLAADKNTCKLAVELLGKGFVRDRQLVKGEVVELGELIVYHTHSIDENKNRYDTVTVVLDGKRRSDVEKVANFVRETAWSTEPEVIVLLSIAAPQETEEVFLQVSAKKIPGRWCCVGIFAPGSLISYRTYGADGKEDVGRRAFSPLMYRELRVWRLANFHLTVLYQSESVYLLLAIAKTNPKDERLFALLSVPEMRAELKDATIHRIVGFEDGFMEAVYAMRAQQAKRSGRLYWNRIIVHSRALSQHNLKQIEAYAARLAPRTVGLGLERLVMYSRRKVNGTDAIEEMELLFENISGYEFTLRGRKPSSRLLEPMDKYVAKIVRARQCSTIYPYEIIKMLTLGQHSDSTRFPRGDFEEFDIEVDAESGESKIISVYKRPYGQNTGNIVFGIITNFTSLPLKRVLILSDATTDMGALAEEECRRVIAALDLAEERHLPVEWIPVSSGARIDMSSGTENLDWTAKVLRRIVTFTQNRCEINVIVQGVNVGAQSYWNAESTMLMHTRGILIMTEDSSMLLTGKKALDFSGCVSAEDNIGIGGVEEIMGPNGESQVWAKDIATAYWLLFRHYDFTYTQDGKIFPERVPTQDPPDRDICLTPYTDRLEQGFKTIGDIFSKEHNPERKKPFDMRQVLEALCDRDLGFLERWQLMEDAETSIIWEARLGGYAVGMIGIESRTLPRFGVIPNNGPHSWSAGTLFPLSSKKVARAINAFSHNLPLLVLANLSGFDGSPESLRNCQLEWGAEIGRAIVNFQGPILFVVVARYHGGAYVVFSHTLNPNLKAIALEGTYASVIGGAPAAAVVFPKVVLKDTNTDPRILEAYKRMQEDQNFTRQDFDEIFQKVYAEKQSALGQHFDEIHCVARAKKVGSIHDVIPPQQLRPYLIQAVEEGMAKYVEMAGKAHFLAPKCQAL